MVEVVDDVQIRVTRSISSWDELSHLIETHSQGDWIFRGVSDFTHRLIPKIGRLQSRKDPATGEVPKFSPEEERRIVEESRRVGRPLQIPQHVGPGFHVMPGRYSTASRA